MYIYRIFTKFWEARYTFWMGSPIKPVEDILTDPDFIREVENELKSTK